MSMFKCGKCAFSKKLESLEKMEKGNILTWGWQRVDKFVIFAFNKKGLETLGERFEYYYSINKNSEGLIWFQKFIGKSETPSGDWFFNRAAKRSD